MTAHAWNPVKVNLPYKKPPITLNSRAHWAMKARQTRLVRRDMALLVKAHPAKLTPLPEGYKLKVELHYRPVDNRRRDTDNLIAVLKPVCDALTVPPQGQIGAGLVKDDTPEYMIKPEPVIHRAYRGRPAMMWVMLTPVPAA